MSISHKISLCILCTVILDLTRKMAFADLPMDDVSRPSSRIGHEVLHGAYILEKRSLVCSLPYIPLRLPQQSLITHFTYDHVHDTLDCKLWGIERVRQFGVYRG